LPDNPPRDRILIIECATHNFPKLIRSAPWQRLMNFVEESEKIVHVTLDVPRITVARRYFVRIFTEPKRLHLAKRVLRVSKFLHTLTYLLTRQIPRGNEAWHVVGMKLADTAPSRVTNVFIRNLESHILLCIKE